MKIQIKNHPDYTNHTMDFVPEPNAVVRFNQADIRRAERKELYRLIGFMALIMVMAALACYGILHEEVRYMGGVL